MPRRFLPGLRGVEGKSIDIDGVEYKTVHVSGGYQSVTYSGSPGFGTEDRAAAWDMATVIVDGYERVVWVFKSVEFIAGHQSRLPFRIGRALDTDEREVLDDHPLYRVLNKRANPLETGRQFRKRLSAQVLLSKRGAFVEVTRSRMGTVTRLDLLPPDRVRPIPDPRGDYLSHFEFITRFGQMREIDPERIRWIRDPHPTDPFCGTTPLEPAGFSVELDHLSRLYNVSFIKNDGRPGGIVGVHTDGLPDQELDRIERKFAPGVEHAGQITVIGTGEHGIDYVDTTTKPREMAYESAAQNAKTEILSAFGLDESVIGSVAARTFDNAEQALYNAYTLTLLPHFDLIADAFQTDIDEGWDPFIDTSSVEVLELPRRKRREEGRAEWNAGLRSMDEYRPMANLDPIGTPYSRALWISPQKAPVPAQPEDAAALGIGPNGGPATPAGPEGGQPGPAAAPAPTPEADAAPASTATDSTAADAVAEARQGDEDSAAAAVGDARTLESDTGPGEAADALEQARGLEGKSLEGKALDAPPAEQTFNVTPAQIDAAELAIRAAMDALLARQSGVLAARITAPKARKGTKFWTADSPSDARGGDKPIDTGKVIDEERWAAETTDTLEPIVASHAQEIAGTILAGMAIADLLSGVDGPDDSALGHVAAQTTAALSLLILTSAAESMRRWLRDLRSHIDMAQPTAESADALADLIRQVYAEHAHPFANTLGTSLAAATVNGAIDAAGAALAPLAIGVTPASITREWVSMHDADVRPSHVDADGQTRLFGHPFQVGAALLRYPGDPLGPARETHNCRCFARYHVTRGVRFLLPPPAEAEAA